MMLVTREFFFTASHFLPDYYGHPEKYHRHRYRLRVTVEGTVQKNGMACDFALLKWVVKQQILARCDGAHLNDFLPIPSAEHIAMWAWKKLTPLKIHFRDVLADAKFHEKIMKHTGAKTFRTWLPKAVRLYEVEVNEDDDTWVTYRKTL